MALRNRAQWAWQQFDDVRLGDQRREQRLRRLAGDVAGAPAASLPKLYANDPAGQEGAYRLLENKRVDPVAIIDGAGRGTAARSSGVPVLLAACDSTTLEFSHGSVRESMGDLGGPKASQKRGLWVHNVLLIDMERALPLGLLHQDYWVREPARRGQRHARKSRPYQDKESYKWERAIEQAHGRLDEADKGRAIYACDREADIFELLHNLRERKLRFIVRAAWNRAVLEPEEEHVWEAAQSAGVVGERTVDVPQRQGRRARRARLELRTGRVLLRPPSRLRRSEWKPTEVHFVYAVEVDPPLGVEPLCWLLLTSEPVETFEQANMVLRGYELRWLVEEFHKSWKSEARVQVRRLQSLEALLVLAVVLAHVAARLLALRTLVESVDPEAPCTAVLDEAEWECLYRWEAHQRRSDPQLPRTPPTARWAYEAVGRIGGWHDTKRTGRVGWQVFWRGWHELERLVEAAAVFGAPAAGQ